MELTDKKVKSASERVELVAGKILKIETTPGGAELLDIEVPAGKKWDVYIYLDIKESNV